MNAKFYLNLANFDSFVANVLVYFLVLMGLNNLAVYQNWQIWSMGQNDNDEDGKDKLVKMGEKESPVRGQV